jgi:DNA-binding CsgD family transcriptional regulator
MSEVIKLPVEDPALAHDASLLTRLLAMHDRLRTADSVSELMARAAEATCRQCGFDRGVVASVRQGALTADAIDPLRDPESDRLRRRLLAEPVPIRPGMLDATHLRRPDGLSGTAATGYLARVLELEHPAVAPVAPEGSAVALLIVDRPRAGAVDEATRLEVALIARVLGVVLEHVVLRARIAEITAELRFLTVSAQALAREAFEGPISLPVHGRHLPSFGRVGYLDDPAAGGALGLTERERSVAELMAQGRSNREIAEQLFLSPETVKDNVARIMRKLGATNRVEAAVRFVQLARETPERGERSAG